MRAYQIFLIISTIFTGGFLLGIAIILGFFAFQDIYHEAIIKTSIDGVLVKTGYFSSLIILVFGILFTFQVKSLRNTLSE